MKTSTRPSGGEPSGVAPLLSAVPVASKGSPHRDTDSTKRVSSSGKTGSLAFRSSSTVHHRCSTITWRSSSVHRSLENDRPELLSDDFGLLEQLPARRLLVALSRFETAAWTEPASEDVARRGDTLEQQDPALIVQHDALRRPSRHASSSQRAGFGTAGSADTAERRSGILGGCAEWAFLR